MSQTFTDDLYSQSTVADTTLTNMENNFAALKSLFSGSAAPSNLVGFMPWGDTTADHEILKRRNEANDAWLAVLSGDAGFKVWVYRNDTCEGWVIDSAITDRVLAVKGGSNAYNVNGGVNAGTWTQPGHTLTASEIPDHAHSGTVNSDGAHTHDVRTYPYQESGGNGVSLQADSSGTFTDISGAALSGGAHTHTFTTDTDGGGDGSHNHGDTYRPAAAVGTLQYPDL